MEYETYNYKFMHKMVYIVLTVSVSVVCIIFSIDFFTSTYVISTKDTIKLNNLGMVEDDEASQMKFVEVKSKVFNLNYYRHKFTIVNVTIL